MLSSCCMMTCTRCNTEKPTADFISTSRAREATGRGTCKACFNGKDNSSVTHRALAAAPSGLRKCRTCKSMLPLSAFDAMPEPDKAHKLRRACRSCCAGNYLGEKQCTRCKAVKSIDAFGPRDDRPGPRSKCKDCDAEIA